MRLHRAETRTRLAPRRASGDVAWTADTAEDGHPLLDRQARFLAQGLGITPARARLIAGLAFNHGERAMNVLAPLAPKLGRLIRLFGSDRDGEVLGTVRTAE